MKHTTIRWPKQQQQQSQKQIGWNGRCGALFDNEPQSDSYVELNPAYEKSSRKDMFKKGTKLTPQGGIADYNSRNAYRQQREQQQLQPPLMMHDFNGMQQQQQQQQQQQFSFSPNIVTASTSTSEYFSSLVSASVAYLQKLYRTSPDLLAVSVASVAIFLAWRIPALHSFLQSHFICNQHNIISGWRSYSLILASMSHISLAHLVVNLVTFLNLGPAVKDILRQRRPRWPLWPLLLGSAVTGNTAHILFGRRDGCLGLSGVTLAMVAVLAQMYPDRILGIRFMGVFPLSMPAHILLKAMLLLSFLGSFRSDSSVAHATHLGGLLFGVIYVELWKRQHALAKRFEF